MATPESQKDTDKDPVGKGKEPREPPAKMVRVDELEASIEKILERTLRKAAEERSAPTEKTTQASTKGEKSPRQE